MAFFNRLAFSDYKNLLLEAYNGAASVPANTNEGSTLGAITNAAALLALQLEQQLLYDAAIARMATSTGADCDSFAYPFGIYREGATATQGPVICSTNSPVSGSPLIVPVGGIVQTPSGLQFTIIADSNNPNYNAGDNGYPIAVGYSSTTVTVVCNSTGTIGNVQANQINQIFGGPGATPMPSVNVNNAVSFADATNAGVVPAIDTETDAAFKNRFTLLVSSGRVATRNAIAGTVLGVQTGLTYSLGDLVKMVDGSPVTNQPGYFTVVVNNAGVNTLPSDQLIDNVYNAIEGLAGNPEVRAAGCSFFVIKPTLLRVDAGCTITVDPNYPDPSAVVAAAETAVAAYINSIGLDPNGNSTVCPYGKVYGIIYGVPGVLLADGLTLNGGSADVTGVFAQQIVSGTISFSQA